MSNFTKYFSFARKVVLEGSIHIHARLNLGSCNTEMTVFVADSCGVMVSHNMQCRTDKKNINNDAFFILTNNDFFFLLVLCRLQRNHHLLLKHKLKFV